MPFNYEQQQCADCWKMFYVRDMEYDFDTEDWLCDECFDERAWKAVERDLDDI